MAESSARSATHTTGMMTRRGVAGMVLVAFLLSGGLVAGVWAEDEVSTLVDIPKIGMKSGQITATHDRSVEISGREYAFHPKIIYADDERNPREWKEFKKGDYVQYRLKQERIDFLVLELPK